MKFLFIFLIFTFNTTAFENCSKMSSDCEFYSCVEKNKLCGKRSYLIGFGHKYCNKFENKEHKFSNEGKLWIEEVKRCLIREVDNLNDNLSCKKFKRSAIAHHVPCYVNSGYCHLKKKDKKNVVKIILTSLWRPSLIKAGLKVLSACRNN